MINLTHPTISNAPNIQAMLDDETTKPLLIKALDLTLTQRETRAQELDRYAVHSGKGTLQTLASVIRRLSAMDIAAIKAHVA